MTSLGLRLSAPILLLLATAANAQVANEFDFDTAQLPLTVLTPGSGTLQINSRVTYTGQHLRLDAHLVVPSGGELILDRSELRVRGDITIRPGGRISVIDSSLHVANDIGGQFALWNEGGLLHTERSVLGGTVVNGAPRYARFMLLRGTWLARHTTVQATGVVIANGPHGWFGNPAHRGGSIFGDGVYEGDFADAIHMCGLGDAVLANGTMNVGFYYRAASAGPPTSATIDLESTRPLDAVYGDPAVHAGLTHPIADALCRLQLIRHRSPTWQFFGTNATSTGPLCTLTLRNVRDTIFGVTGENLAGAPILAGPWTSHYSELPGLPSTVRPGYHAIPPTCSVQIGNIVFRSDANEWSRVMSWGLYLHGANTNYAVVGPSSIAEVMVWGGQVHLGGSRSYDLGVLANVAWLFNGAVLDLDNVALGTHVPSLGWTGVVEANDSSHVSITDSRVAPTLLRTTAPGAYITTQRLIGAEQLTTQSGGGGVVQVQQASPAQNFDLQNLSMDVAGAGVPFWAVSGLTSSLVTDGAPGAPGNLSRELASGPAGGTMWKSLLLPPETHVTVVARTRLMQLSGPAPSLRISQGGNVTTASLGTAIGSWRSTLVPLLTVSGSGSTVIELVCPGAATLRIDDVRVSIGSWWDNDNLANLAFEGGCRHTHVAPWYFRSPDAWNVSQAICEPDSNIVRPGAASGSRSVRATMPLDYGLVVKDLTFLRPGEQVVVSGWMRGSASAQVAGVAAQIGDGPTWRDPAVGNNRQVIQPSDGAWRPFTLAYTVPPNPTTTHLGLSGFGASGSQCWFDDLTVSIQ